MSENKDESNDSSSIGISDDQLPEDLVPSEDNPLAEGLPDGETIDGLLTEGKRPEGAEDQQQDDDPPGYQSTDNASSSAATDQDTI